ncbi:transcriptional regulator, TetR family [Zhouia amylolytica]|uniref:Transcriptional regulator, TetR family n=1 Tax=Zhouia amylolytica TaxID=376730 RepID=A0A1I6PIJ3_9FLAO|nr:TetR/AcrR family transcriptional regulator [Zhouia amylolytica]SFS40024.1 transcriptional regulator, TetR family [Zhouia amylolytica]
MSVGSKGKNKKLKTKQRIINQAIALFNKDGVRNVTIRNIASEMAIAHGNLTYHYKNKEDLLLAIYGQMRIEMSQSYILSKDSATSFEHFHRLLLHLEHFQLKYRFFNLDVLEISRTFSKINEVLQDTLLLRRDQMVKLFQGFLDEDLIDGTSVDDYTRLRHTIRILITFWLSQMEVFPESGTKEEGEMVAHIWNLIKPHMTENGKKEFTRVSEQFLRYEEEV